MDRLAATLPGSVQHRAVGGTLSGGAGIQRAVTSLGSVSGFLRHGQLCGFRAVTEPLGAVFRGASSSAPLPMTSPLAMQAPGRPWEWTPSPQRPQACGQPGVCSPEAQGWDRRGLITPWVLKQAEPRPLMRPAAPGTGGRGWRMDTHSSYSSATSSVSDMVSTVPAEGGCSVWARGPAPSAQPREAWGRMGDPVSPGTSPGGPPAPPAPTPARVQPGSRSLLPRDRHPGTPLVPPQHRGPLHDSSTASGTSRPPRPSDGQALLAPAPRGLSTTAKRPRRAVTTVALLQPRGALSAVGRSEPVTGATWQVCRQLCSWGKSQSGDAIYVTP